MARIRDAFIGKKLTGGWTIKEYLSSGVFSTVYGVSRKDGNRAVIKIERRSELPIEHEIGVMQRLQHLCGFPEVYESGTVKNRTMVVMQRLGPSLGSLLKSHQIRSTDILKIGIQLVWRLWDMHTQGFVHRDLHPGNVLTAGTQSGIGQRLYLIDFGESGQVNGRTPNRVYGKMGFASTAALRKKRYGAKDDLESLVYLLLYVYTGTLPWRRVPSKSEHMSDLVRRCLEIRSSMSPTAICHGLPNSITNILRDVGQMQRKEVPDYERYIRNMRASLRYRNASENEKFSWE